MIQKVLKILRRVHRKIIIMNPLRKREGKVYLKQSIRELNFK